MAAGSLRFPLVPRTGDILRVVCVTRISTLNQDLKSLEDQQALLGHWLKQHADCGWQVTQITSRGKGEVLDRQELSELDEMIESRDYDLILTEDLGRIVRRVHGHLVCEHCVDTNTRLISLNDRIDTAEDGWQRNSFFAVMHHEQHNEDTSLRIKRTLNNRFLNGGVLRSPLFCYDFPKGAKHDSEMRKIPDLAPIVEGIFQRLEGSFDGTEWSYEAVADWLNTEKVPLGKGAWRSKAWYGDLVRYFIRNPILKGQRLRNRKITKRINSTGKRISVNAPLNERKFRPAPHLAFVDAARYDRLMDRLRIKNAQYRAGQNGKRDPRQGRPKKRTRFPGQMVDCGICGRPFVFGGHGQLKHLVCQGADRHKCWNGITVDSELASELIPQLVFAQIEKLPEFEATIREVFEAEREHLMKHADGRRAALSDELNKVERREQNLIEMIEEHGGSLAIKAKLEQIETKKKQLNLDLDHLNSKNKEKIPLPTVAAAREQIISTFADLARDSVEFRNQMFRLIGRIKVFPIRFLNEGILGLRAQFSLKLHELLPESSRTDQVVAHLSCEMSVDLIKLPQKARYMHEIAQMRSSGMSTAEIAEALGITKTVVGWSTKLYRQMQQMGLTDPIIVLTEPPKGARLRRHKHLRYRFDPLPPDE
jgi:site-specific DNA recombinase